MKKCLMKILCIVLSAALCMPLVCLFAFAEDGAVEYHECDRLYKISQFPEDGVIYPRTVRPARQFAGGSSGTYKFYDYLSPTEKQIYNSLKDSALGLNSATRGWVPIEFSSSRNLPSESSSALEDNILRSSIAAIEAIMEDYPEFFWLYLFGYNYGSSVSGSTYYLSSLNIILVYNENAYASWDVVEEEYNSLLDHVADFEVKGTSRYAKLKSIHDGIAAMAEYDPNFATPDANPRAHEPISVFEPPYYTVCEGYSEAFKLICDRENIPCICVVGDAGGAHKWNYVQMEDGQWYGVDVTWDDQKMLIYDFFLMGSSSKDAHFGGKQTFIEEHRPTGLIFNIDIALTYPSLGTYSYTTGMLDAETQAVFSNPKGMMFIPKGAVLADQFIGTSAHSDITPDDHTVSVSGVTTSAEVTVLNVGAGQRIYKVVRWGDVDSSNSVDGTDVSLLNGAAGLQNSLSDECQYAAGDLNEDGVVDGFDAIYLQLYAADRVEKY